MPKGQYVRKPRATKKVAAKRAAKAITVSGATPVRAKRRSRDAVQKERLLHFVETSDLPPKLMLVWIMEGALRHINSILGSAPRRGGR